MDGSIAKKKEPGSTKMEPTSSIEESHPKRLIIQTNPVYNSSEEVILIEERKWNDIPSCQYFKGHTSEAEVSKLVMRLVRHYFQHGRETYYAVHWKSMGPKLPKAFQKAGRQKLSDSD